MCKSNVIFWDRDVVFQVYRCNIYPAAAVGRMDNRVRGFSSSIHTIESESPTSFMPCNFRIARSLNGMANCNAPSTLMRFSILQKHWLVIIFFTVLQLSVLYCNGQGQQKEPQPELALGIKAVTRQIQYGKSSLYVTDPSSIALQLGIRYDEPRKISTDRYIDLAGQAGFLFCKAIVFDTAYIDPNTNSFTRQHSHNPAYFPVYFGAYNRSAVSAGAEVFYWKGLGTSDIWGVKFLSLGYNGKQFRLAAAGEWYAQIKNGKNSGMLFSVDFCWKLISGRYKAE